MCDYYEVVDSSCRVEMRKNKKNEKKEDVYLKIITWSFCGHTTTFHERFLAPSTYFRFITMPNEMITIGKRTFRMELHKIAGKTLQNLKLRCFFCMVMIIIIELN